MKALHKHALDHMLKRQSFLLRTGRYPHKRYAVSNDNVTQLVQPGTFNDQLTEILRNGAHALLAHAVEAEVAAFLDSHADLKTNKGHQRVVRHGYLPEREVMTGIGAVTVRQPRARDREAAADNPDRVRFTPSILPPYARRSKSIETLLPILYLKGISTGDFSEALAALLGPNAPGLSATTIARLKQVWSDEHTRWQSRDLSARHYVYVWADGIHLQARLEDEKQCILVIIGATPEGKKELVGFTDGTRESAHDWRALLLDLKRRGLNVAPKVAVADGALGFWKALGEVWPTTREQRCWVHVWMPPFVQVIFEQYECVIECDHVSGLKGAAFHMAAGRYGDARIRAKSQERAMMLDAPNWFPQSRSDQSLALTVRRSPHTLSRAYSWILSLGCKRGGISVILFLCQHGPDATGHLVRKRNGNQHLRLLAHCATSFRMIA